MMRFPRNEFSQFCEETFFGLFLWYNVSRNSEQKECHEKLQTTNVVRHYRACGRNCERRTESRRSGHSRAGKPLKEGLKMNPIDYLIDIVAENSANPNRKVSFLCVISIMIGILECCYIYGMTKCFYHEAKRFVIHSFNATMLGRSRNIHLYEPKHTDMWPKFYDSLMADARTHTPGWYRIGMIQDKTNQIFVACSLVDKYEDLLALQRRGTGFCLGFNMSDNGRVRDLRIQETLRPLYWFDDPSVSLAEKRVVEFDNSTALLAYKKKMLHEEQEKRLDAASSNKEENEVSK